ncbi:MAG: hypothetical protein UX62_C0018G0011 [Microgenomates group bacterium GW2011_GWA2_46_7]|nr:MAG: hypothetical protein UX62_C0018G0011 [Microgenomates group bacterium GW2011_GWA2_46_7]
MIFERVSETLWVEYTSDGAIRRFLVCDKGYKKPNLSIYPVTILV